MRSLILDQDDPFVRARRYVPVYMWLVGFMISMVTLTKGLKHVGLSADLGFGSNFANALALSVGVGLAVALVGGSC